MRTSAMWMACLLAALGAGCGGGSETAAPMAAPPVIKSSTAANAPAADPVTFRACCDAADRDAAARP